MDKFLEWYNSSKSFHLWNICNSFVHMHSWKQVCGIWNAAYNCNFLPSDYLKIGVCITALIIVNWKQKTLWICSIIWILTPTYDMWINMTIWALFAILVINTFFSRALAKHLYITRQISFLLLSFLTKEHNIILYLGYVLNIVCIYGSIYWFYVLWFQTSFLCYTLKHILVRKYIISNW